MLIGSIRTSLNMKSYAINIITVLVFGILLFSFSPSVQANVPDKKVCVVNENDQPLLFEGQGLWVKMNNVYRNFWFAQADASGCTTFNGRGQYWFDNMRGKRADTDFDGTQDSTIYTEGTAGCGEGPHGFQVVVPKAWADEWECQSMGTAKSNGNSPDNPGGTHDPAYDGEFTEKQCTCGPDVRSGQDNTACPVCFGNSGTVREFKLQCRKKGKTTSSLTLEQPRTEQFSPPKGKMVDCLGSAACLTAGAPASASNNAVQCSVTPEAGGNTRRYQLLKYRDAALKYTESTPNNQSKLLSPVYITECIMEGTNEEDARYVCTTGSAAVDSKAGLTTNGQVSFNYLSSTYGYKGQIFNEKGEPLQQPFDDIAQLSDIYEWETTTSKPVSSTFGIFYDAKYATSQSSGDNPSQLQRTLSFVGACNLHIDPVGKVFDNHTLEPIPGVNMSLERSNGSLVSKLTTKKDGKFSFYVQPGTYRLIPEINGYTFPIITSLNKLAVSLYGDIYKGGDLKVEKSVIFTDIPMDPVDKKASEEMAKNNPPEVMEYFQSINKATNEYVVQGQVSHPKARINITTTVANNFHNGELHKSRVIANTTADKDGIFTVSFPLDKMKKNETVDALEVVKPENFYPYGNKGKTVVLLNPILNSVKGTAYDSQGNIIPGAIVSVKLPVFTDPVYQVTANEKGFFEIPAEKLPPMPYELTFTGLGKTEPETVNTRTFIAQNARKNSNLSRYYAARPDSLMQAVLGESTEYTESFASSDNFFVNNKPVVLAGLFIFMLITSIPLYNLYSKHEHKRRK